jgi:hypothetical protein
MNTIKYIGIDVHQATSVFAIRDHQGNLVGEAIPEAKPKPIIDFLKGQRGTVWVTFEEGTYVNGLYDVIHPQVAIDVKGIPVLDGIDQLPDPPGFRIQFP